MGSLLLVKIWCEAMSEMAAIFFFEVVECVVRLQKFVKCLECGVVSCGQEAFCRHFKTLHGTFLPCAVGDEVCILIILLCIPVFNVSLTGTS